MTEKLPVVDLEKWGSRILGSTSFAEQMPMTDAQFTSLVEQLPLEDKPCGVTLDAQTLGKLWADKCSPGEFNQFLFMNLKQAGCSAVEGVLRMKLTRGKVFKLRSAPGDMEFHYMWMPPVLCAALGVMDRESLVQ